MKKILLLAILFLAAIPQGKSQIEKDKKKTVYKMANLISILEKYYVDSVNSSEIVEEAIRGILEKLDPHSYYIPAKKVSDAEAPLKGNFEGVGIQFRIIKDTLFVVRAIAGGPSKKVGITSGDQVVKIDGELVAGVGLTNSGVRKRLLGKKGTKVTMDIKRGGEKNLLDFEVIRDKIPIFSVDASYMVDDKIGYIKINKFSRTTVDEFLKGFIELKSQGMESLIIDLQNNTGGYLNEAIDLIDHFLSENKLIVYTDGIKSKRKNYSAAKEGVFEKGKLVVLVNKGSASASEIFSGAIQDWDRGAVVGRRTFGKGLVQHPFTLSDKSKIRLTTQRYYIPSGRCIQKPYKNGSKEYRKEKYERFLNGESFHKDSIKIPDSLMFRTRIKKRKVYAGGGVIPDVFVPLDTTGISNYFKSLLRKGVFNIFALEYVKKNREELTKKHPTFKSFKTDFDLKSATNEMIEYATSKGIKYDENQFKKSEQAITIRLKAKVAENLWNTSEFYEIFNELNTTYTEGVKLLKSKRNYRKIGLAK